MRAGTSELEYAESLGETLDAAITKAVDILGAREDEVDVEVLQEGRRGFLWFIPRIPYRVRVSWRADHTHEEIVGEGGAAAEPAPERRSARPPGAEAPAVPSREHRRERSRRDREAPARRPEREREAGHMREVAPGSQSAQESDPARDAERFMTRVFEKLEIPVQLAARSDDGAVRIRVSGRDAESFLAEREGEVESALQVLTHRVVSRRAARAIPVAIEVGAQGSSRDAGHRATALRLADEVARTGRWAETDPLPASARRIVHRALADHPAVTTESQGRGLLKKVRVLPKS
jgi:spoIIIJ-associated protein